MHDAKLFEYATTMTEEEFILKVRGVAEEYKSDNWDAADNSLRILYGYCNMSVKEIRNITGMTQTKFAEYTYTPVRTVEDWESGRRNIPDRTKFLLLEFLGLFERDIPMIESGVEYAVKSFRIEVNRKDFLKLRGMDKKSVERQIIDWALEDTDPETRGVYTDKETAFNHSQNLMDVTEYSITSGLIYSLIVSGIVEEYVVDEEGEFLEGSNYDWRGEFLDDDEFKKIQEYI